MLKTVGNQPLSADNSGASNEASGHGVDAPESALTTDAGEGIDMADSHSIAGRAPAFQFYPKDFLTDSNVVVMSLQERGAYITLICQCWIEGSIPADEARIARLCGSPAAAFRKLWPALAPCFRPAKRGSDRLVHTRLERERLKQIEFRAEQSERGKSGAAARWRKDSAAMPTPSPKNGTATISPMANHGSSSSISNLQSSSSSADSSRSNRVVFRCERFVVWDWMLSDLTRMLGAQVEAFDLHAWFFELSAKADAAGLVVPQRDGGKWLQEQTLVEAERRGLAVATVQQGTGKTAGNLAAAARFVARGAK